MPDFVRDGDTDEVTAFQRGHRRVRPADRSEPEASKLFVDGRTEHEHDWQLPARVRYDAATGMITRRGRGGHQADVDRQRSIRQRLTVRARPAVVPVDRNRRRFEQRAGHLSCEFEIGLRDRRMPKDIRVQGDGENQG